MCGDKEVVGERERTLNIGNEKCFLYYLYKLYLDWEKLGQKFGFGVLKGPYKMPITFLSPRAQPEVVYFWYQMKAPYFSDCKSKNSASNSLQFWRYTKNGEINWYRPFSHCIDQAGLGTLTAKSGRKHYNPPPLTVMWMNFDSPNFPSLCSLSAIILFQTCSNKCILYVLSFHKCIKIKYKMVNMYGVFLWLVQSSSRWYTIHSHRNCSV